MFGYSAYNADMAVWSKPHFDALQRLQNPLSSHLFSNFDFSTCISYSQEIWRMQLIIQIHSILEEGISDLDTTMPHDEDETEALIRQQAEQEAPSFDPLIDNWTLVLLCELGCNELRKNLLQFQSLADFMLIILGLKMRMKEEKCTIFDRKGLKSQHHLCLNITADLINQFLKQKNLFWRKSSTLS